MRIFTIRRPNAFRSFKEMLKEFKTGVGEKKTKTQNTNIGINSQLNCGRNTRETKSVNLYIEVK